MNNIWSEHIQGIHTLYLSRKLRFDDTFFDRYDKLFCIDKKSDAKILELGCGPGAISEALHRWYPDTEIYGIDRDTNFIEFAKNNIEGVRFIEGDIASLPFPDNTFDITISYTVQEHIEPSSFWGEQYRVLKPGGVCICLSVRKGIKCLAPCLYETEAEKEFWADKPGMEEDFEKFRVCRFPLSESEIPQTMQKYGFGNISVGYAVIDLTPDDPKYSASMAEAMIESDRQCDIEAIYSAHSKSTEKVIEAVNKKYDERISLYRNGIKQWDTSVSLTMIIRGIKNSTGV